MVRELVSRRPAVSPLEAVQEKPERGHVLVHLPDLLVDPTACEFGNRLLPQGRAGALGGHFDAKEFGRLASSGERNRMKIEQTCRGVPLGLDIATRS
jgi:hypothetical protein